MRLFAKKLQAEPPGRRRPLAPGAASAQRPAQAFSYYSQRPAAGTPATDSRETTDMLTQNRTVRHGGRPGMTPLRRLLAGSAAVLVAVAGLYMLILDDTPSIVLAEDKATAYFLQDPEVYEQSARQTLESSVFNHSKLTVDTGAVRLNLLQTYPEIKNVSVGVPVLGRQPQVYIEPYEPSFILTTTSSNAYLLDATGRALATTTAIDTIDKLDVPTLEDRSGIMVERGKRAVPRATVSFAQTILAALESAGVTPSAIVLPPAAHELDVSIAETPYYVKFNLQDDPLQQAGTFLATKKRLEADRVRPGQYIDVRVAGRAYYK